MKEAELLNSSDVTSFLICSLIGVELIRLSYTVATITQQDGWLPVILGSIYPLYIILLCNYIAKKFPCHDLIDISKILFGKVLGSILVLIFCIQFILYIPQMISDVISINYVYISPHLSPTKISIITTLIVFYSATRGLKVLCKASAPIVILTLLLTIFVSLPIKRGSILNLMPILSTAKISKILEASINTSYSYTTIELILLIHPFVKNKKNLKRDSLISLLVVTIMYTWTVVINLYLFGTETIIKTNWPLVFNSESLITSAIISFRYIFLFLWSPNAYIAMSIEYYILSYIVSKTFNFSIKKVSIVLLPIFIVASVLMYNLKMLNFTKTFAVPYLVIFNIAYITSLTIFTYIKSKKNRLQNSL
ncbi:GerAB/ArcD/ProY family transporter [Clostridium amazonitimonense]|uniref:GerAB/ArcD/ProY family transporter n=1 Tax=Clostridium amazonitimonense TaxID=1499689 RepID=UPI000509D0E7|nr:GerAB/ArcD/ProY family transporter [Clostridium amazonitimonense]